MLKEGGLDNVGVTLFGGHGATAISDAIAHEGACASAGVAAELWLTILELMKAQKQCSFNGTKALNEHLLEVSAKTPETIVVVDCYFGETSERANEEKHIYDVRNILHAGGLHCQYM
jgi:hypothetical protein